MRTTFLRYIFILCFFSICININADNSESVYSLDLKKDIVISALAIGTFGYPYFIMDGKEKDPNNFDKKDVNIFDRGLMFEYNKALIDTRYVMNGVIFGFTALSPMILGGGSMWKEFDTWLTYGTMFLQAGLLTYGTRLFIGKQVSRYRPNNYFLDNDYESRGNNDSFPSDTSAMAFMHAAFLSVTFSAEYPDSPMKIPVIAGVYSLAATLGVLSIVSGQHFLSDVLVGAAIGSFYGWVIPTLHRRTDDRVSFIFTGNGAMVSVKF